MDNNRPHPSTQTSYDNYKQLVRVLETADTLRAQLYSQLQQFDFSDRVRVVMQLHWQDKRHVFTTEELRKLLGQSPAAFNRLVEQHKPQPPKPAVTVDSYGTALLEGFAARGQRGATLDLVLAQIELKRKRQISGRERTLFEEALNTLITSQLVRRISATPNGNGLYAAA